MDVGLANHFVREDSRGVAAAQPARVPGGVQGTAAGRRYGARGPLPQFSGAGSSHAGPLKPDIGSWPSPAREMLYTSFI